MPLRAKGALRKLIKEHFVQAQERKGLVLDHWLTQHDGSNWLLLFSFDDFRTRSTGTTISCGCRADGNSSSIQGLEVPIARTTPQLACPMLRPLVQSST